MPRMSDDEILAAVEAAEAMALGPTTSEIASDRADALDRYLGKPYGDEQTGRSQVISRDVSDVVEGVTANVLKPFVAGDEVVQFNPRGPEDEEQAKQETDYVNFIALERNNGFLVLNSAIKDALLLRNGYVKASWRKREDVTVEDYSGLSEEELTALMQDEDVEVIGQQGYPDPSFDPMAGFAQGTAPPPDPMAGQQPGTAPQAPGAAPSVPPPPMQPPMLFDVKVKRKGATEYCEILPVPPDETRVSHRLTTPSLQDADFFQHATHRTLSELREMGYKVSDDLTDDDRGDTVEDTARNLFQSGAGLWDDPTTDPSRRVVLFRETWMRLDADGDGIAELRRICSVGQTMLANEDTDLIPFACGTPVIMAHKHLGLSLYDFVKDLAQIKTVITRLFLDNKYLGVNAEKVINIDAVDNFDDFLTSRPGGIKRVRGNPADAVMPLVTPDMGTSALQALEYLDTVRENRSGYTRTAAGLDSNAIATETATGYMQQVSQAQLRLEMMARTIAETLVRDLFRIVHAITLKHSSKAEKVRLRGKWVLVNPREWVRRTDLSIAIGLGTGTADARFQRLMAMGPIIQQGQMMGMVGPEEGFNYATELWKEAGYKNPERFIHPVPKDPQTGQPQVPPPQPSPQEKVAQINAQTEMQKMQAQQQDNQHKFAAEAQLKQQELGMTAEAKQREQQGAMALQASNDQRDAQAQQLQHERELQKMAMQDALDREKMNREFEFKYWEASQKQQTEHARMQHEGDTQERVAQAAGVDTKGEDRVTKALSPVLEAMHEHIKAVNAPKQIVRDKNGRAIGVQSVK